MTEQEFLADVNGHEMQVLHCEGLYRHLRFKQPGTSSYHFDLVTFPGKLVYTGDMGTFVFARLADMFEFFRTDREYALSKGSQLGINTGYWSEKLIAVDGGREKAGAKEFCGESFKRVINEYRVRWMRDAKGAGSLDKDERRELWDAVDDELLSDMDDCGEDAQRRAYDFSWRSGSYEQAKPSWSFTDLFEHNFTRYTHSFFWCCYAIAWGIQQYDNAHQLEAA